MSAELYPVEEQQTGGDLYLYLPPPMTGMHNIGLGESIRSIAVQHALVKTPKAIQAYEKQLIKLNYQTFRTMGIDPARMKKHKPLPYISLVLPKPNNDVMSVAMAQQHARNIHFHSTPTVRQKLNQVINDSTELNTVNSVSMLSYAMHLLFPADAALYHLTWDNY